MINIKKILVVSALVLAILVSGILFTILYKGNPKEHYYPISDYFKIDRGIPDYVRADCIELGNTRLKMTAEQVIPQVGIYRMTFASNTEVLKKGEINSLLENIHGSTHDQGELLVGYCSQDENVSRDWILIITWKDEDIEIFSKK